ncbi:MAG TPA: hypothetical protein VK588_11210 [Chitinophagaceae bacterium]|nr:hypothetical protein [Chitinophagaceae bacterium]
MKQQPVNQEVILFTSTSFAKKEFCELDPPVSGKRKDHVDELEKACWSGLVFDMLPGLFNTAAPKRRYIRQVRKAQNFLLMTLGPVAFNQEYETSIDPYYFQISLQYNN